MLCDLSAIPFSSIHIRAPPCGFNLYIKNSRLCEVPFVKMADNAIALMKKWRIQMRVYVRAVGRLR